MAERISYINPEDYDKHTGMKSVKNAITPLVRDQGKKKQAPQTADKA